MNCSGPKSKGKVLLLRLRVATIYWTGSSVLFQYRLGPEVDYPTFGVFPVPSRVETRVDPGCLTVESFTHDLPL